MADAGLKCPRARPVADEGRTEASDRIDDARHMCDSRRPRTADDWLERDVVHDVWSDSSVEEEDLSHGSQVSGSRRAPSKEA